MIKTDALTNYTRSAEELNINHSMVIWRWKQIEKVKSVISGCLMNWPQVKKTHHFEVLSSLILSNNNEPFLNWIVTCDEKWIV